MSAQKFTAKKRAMIKALEASLGIVTTACKNAKVSRRTYYNWLKEDEAFKEAVEDIHNISLDFAESKLYDLIKDDNVTATIFYLKTRGKKRGYIERQELSVEGEVKSKLIEWRPAE
jgi:hypothetical protein